MASLHGVGGQETGPEAGNPEAGNPEFADYWHEISDIEDTKENEEVQEEDVSKTPDGRFSQYQGCQASVDL